MRRKQQAGEGAQWCPSSSVPQEHMLYSCPGSWAPGDLGWSAGHREIFKPNLAKGREGLHFCARRACGRHALFLPWLPPP